VCGFGTLGSLGSTGSFGSSGSFGVGAGTSGICKSLSRGLEQLKVAELKAENGVPEIGYVSVLLHEDAGGGMVKLSHPLI